MLAGFLSCVVENPTRFLILLPFPTGVLFGHERLFAHKNYVKSRAEPLCFAQSEIKRAARSPNGAKNCFTRKRWQRHRRRGDEFFPRRRQGWRTPPPAFFLR